MVIEMIKVNPGTRGLYEFLANFGIDRETYGADGVQAAANELRAAVSGGVEVPAGYAHPSHSGRPLKDALVSAMEVVGLTFSDLAEIADNR